MWPRAAKAGGSGSHGHDNRQSSSGTAAALLPEGLLLASLPLLALPRACCAELLELEADTVRAADGHQLAAAGQWGAFAQDLGVLLELAAGGAEASAAGAELGGPAGPEAVAASSALLLAGASGGNNCSGSSGAGELELAERVVQLLVDRGMWACCRLLDPSFQQPAAGVPAFDDASSPGAAARLRGRLSSRLAALPGALALCWRGFRPAAAERAYLRFRSRTAVAASLPGLLLTLGMWIGTVLRCRGEEEAAGAKALALCAYNAIYHAPYVALLLCASVAAGSLLTRNLYQFVFSGLVVLPAVMQVRLRPALALHAWRALVANLPMLLHSNSVVASLRAALLMFASTVAVSAWVDGRCRRRFVAAAGRGQAAKMSGAGSVVSVGVGAGVVACGG